MTVVLQINEVSQGLNFTTFCLGLQAHEMVSKEGNQLHFNPKYENKTETNSLQ